MLRRWWHEAGSPVLDPETHQITIPEKDAVAFKQAPTSKAKPAKIKPAPIHQPLDYLEEITSDINPEVIALEDEIERLKWLNLGLRKAIVLLAES